MTGAMALLAMIRMIREHRVRAIELLGEQDAHERVRERELGERPFEVRALQHFRREAVGTADEEREIAPVLHALAEPGGERLRRHFFAALIERDDVLVLAYGGEQSLTFDLDRPLRARTG